MFIRWQMMLNYALNVNNDNNSPTTTWVHIARYHDSAMPEIIITHENVCHVISMMNPSMSEFNSSFH